jgi:YebC/PmpR family DNA-binding regulatory protein
MAGHSKWANIKRHKAAQDAKRGKLYTKLIREVSVAAKLGGGDPNTNPRLRAALDKAQDANMTKDVIERAIKRGIGGMEGENLEEVRYEGYGPGGIAIIVDCLTNNRNRTVADVRHVFTKYGGNLGTDGSVAYLFKKQGRLIFAPDVSEEALLNMALTLGVEDIQVQADLTKEVITLPEQFHAVKEAFIKGNFVPQNAQVTLIPSTPVPINDKDTVETIINLMDALEDLDDVQEIYSNVTFSEDALKALN